MLPKALRKGDKVAVISPGSPVRRPDNLKRGLDRLRSWGLVPELMPNAMRKLPWPEGGPLAGSDAQRLEDLQTAIGDSEYRAVICSRGGYGCTRLLDQLDFAPLRKDPKPILGYSDVTALLAAAHKEVGLIGFHGPMLANPPSHAMGEDNERLQRQLLTDPRRPATLPTITTPHALRTGTAEGPLVGGNLSLVAALIGTPWEIDTNGALLFLEDVGEAPYRIDRMLTQLRQTGALSRAAGVVLGDFHLEDTEPGSEAPEVLRVLHDRLGDLEAPVAHGFPFGHRPRSWTLPVGVRARLQATDAGAEATLRLLQPAVG